MPRYRIGIDTGGTFTDLVVLDETTGHVASTKVPSTPQDPSIAFGRALERATERLGVDPRAVSFIFHGTTVATNALLQRRLARTALVTTEGFRDVLEIGRHRREDMYDLFLERPAPLVPRWWRVEVPERADHLGNVVLPLDEAAARAVARRLREESVEAVAISFLHAYANPMNERRMADILADEAPGVAISVSSEASREIREFERTSTTVVNAALLPLVGEYVGRLEDAVRAAGADCPLLLMQSSGGAMTAAAARTRPVALVLSGPAAGVNACRALGQAISRPHLLGFDMGGTSTDVAAIRNGEAALTVLGTIEQQPITVPMLELHTIGAGGGSIAWLDEGGALRVGPQSAGADPGPAAYARGGTEPTVTDANLVLGRLNPHYFLAREMAVDVAASRRAIETRIAGPLGLSLEEAADGMLRVANANMERAIRVASVEKGYDPREFALVAAGGAGPLHAGCLAQVLHIPLVVVPAIPGNFSALGLLYSDLRADFAQTQLIPASAADPAQVTHIFAALDAAALQRLAADRVSAADQLLQRTVDVRYVGQAYEVAVPVPDGSLDAAALAGIVARFHVEHQRLFAHSATGEPVAFVTFRVAAVGRIVPPTQHRLPGGTQLLEQARKERRPVYFHDHGGFIPCAIYDRERLTPDHALVGPSIVEQADTTTVVYPDQSAVADEFGNLLISPTLPATLPVTALVTSAQIPSQADQEQRRG